MDVSQTKEERESGSRNARALALETRKFSMIERGPWPAGWVTATSVQGFVSAPTLISPGGDQCCVGSVGETI